MAPRQRWFVGLLVAALVAVACAPSPTVRTERADSFGDVLDDTFTADEPADDTAPADDEPPGPSDPGDPDEPDAPGTTVADPVVVDPDAINFGDNKPPRDYDDYLLATANDLEVWLAEEYPSAFGGEWLPLQGEIWAGYPERTDPIPGCGQRETSYEELQLFVAFYCPPGNGGPSGDFIVYDDGNDPIFIPGVGRQEPILSSLAEQFGPATIGIVLAHEYGHAIQERTGALDQNLPTVVTEQQADCVAGAWAGRAEAGQATGVPFTDSDTQAGLIAMITVQDPIGTNPLAAGGHGSGFDRVGAFQVGFNEGLARCAQLIENPLPLVLLDFVGDRETEGNAPFGFEENQLFDFLPQDLNLLYDNDLEADFPNFEPLTLVPVSSLADATCGDLSTGFENGAALCDESSTVYLNVPVAQQIYDEFGDFAPGYLLGVAWAEAALLSNGSTLLGEERALEADCLTGNWVRTVIPERDANGNLVLDDEGFIVLPQPRDPGRGASVSPNDLTEAIQIAILIGDEDDEVNTIGSAFEKIDAFRQGTLFGLDSC